MSKDKFIVDFKDVGKEDISLVGGKGANLGEMTKAGFPVPSGFIVTSYAYYHFLDIAKLRDEIRDTLYFVKIKDNSSLEKASTHIKKCIIESHFPKKIAHDIFHAYFSLGKGIKNPYVAVRSSATAEDLPEASFAGQQDTFLNVHGEANLIEKIKEAWASLFTARAIFYREIYHFDHFKVGIAVPVQKMVDAQYSGTMFTVDPVTNDKKKIVIEAIYGLGELLVKGKVIPDRYEVRKADMKIIAKFPALQNEKMIRYHGGNKIQKIKIEEKTRIKLNDSMITRLSEFGVKLEKHYYFPQDIEWAIENDNVYIVQTRPVTTTGISLSQTEKGKDIKKEVFLKGNAASPGIAFGPVKILTSPKKIHLIKAGDILVARQTNPDFVPAMRKAVAIITESGGRTSHAAIVSRELGIPAVVGVEGVLKKLRDNQIITVNGSTGEIYKGSLEGLISNKRSPVKSNSRVKTITKVYVNLAEPNLAEPIAKKNVDGIGLLRAEFMIADIGTHPRLFIKEKREREFISKLSHNLFIFCKAFSPRPVIYRATDFRTNEYRNLKGGDKYEPYEENPMLGFRGAARYIADPHVFELELHAIKRVRNVLGYRNLSLMIPFVRNPRELIEVKKIIIANGLSQSSTFHLWMMAELPTNVLILDKYIDAGIDGVSIGSNDLTMLILGTDRDSSDVAHNFNELDESVLWAIEHVIKTCNKRGISCSICGQAPSDYPEFVEKLVKWGITSISVNPDAIDRVRDVISETEQKIKIK